MGLNKELLQIQKDMLIMERDLTNRIHSLENDINALKTENKALKTDNSSMKEAIIKINSSLNSNEVKAMNLVSQMLDGANAWNGGTSCGEEE